MSHDSQTSSLDRMALAHPPDGLRHAYNEAAFRHFLGMEQRRSERVRCSLVLLLVGVQAEDGAGASTAEIGRLLPALGGCVREVDVVGWYRAGSVAGAVLTQAQAGPAPDALGAIAKRVEAKLRDHLPNRIQVRAFQLRGSG